MKEVHLHICCCRVQLLSHVQLFATPWTVAHQAPLPMGILQARILEWVAICFSSEHIENSQMIEADQIPSYQLSFPLVVNALTQ